MTAVSEGREGKGSKFKVNLMQIDCDSKLY
jgi:hypothetical protein